MQVAGGRQGGCENNNSNIGLINLDQANKHTSYRALKTGDSSDTALCVLAMAVPSSMVEAYPQPTVRRWPGFPNSVVSGALASPPSVW